MRKYGGKSSESSEAIPGRIAEAISEKKTPNESSQDFLIDFGKDFLVEFLKNPLELKSMEKFLLETLMTIFLGKFVIVKVLSKHFFLLKNI